MAQVKIKRVYESPQKTDGYRVLVDRLWPRGLSKEKARIDAWIKEAAPSTDLRKWFSHDPEKWKEFRVRYRKELKSNDEAKSALLHLKEIARKEKSVTLLFAAHDSEHNNALVLKELLK